MELDLAIMALLIAGYSLVAGSLSRRSVGPAFAFVVIGVAAVRRCLGPISLEPRPSR